MKIHAERLPPLDRLPYGIRAEIWAWLVRHAAVQVATVRVLLWKRTITLRDLFPLFVRLLGQPGQGLADPAIRP